MTMRWHVGIGLCLLAVEVAEATTFIPVSVGDQVANGALIIEADVVSVEFGQVFLDGEPLPVRWFELGNADTEGATPTDRIRLIIPGGPIGDMWTSFHGAPEVAVGDHVVLVGFIDDAGILRLASIGNSVFRRVGRDNAHAINEAGRVVDGFSCDATETGMTPPGQAPLPTEWGEFVQEIRACGRTPGAPTVEP